MFRNKELRWFAALFALITGCAIIWGFMINTTTGILSALSSAAFGAVFFVFTKARYKSIERISHRIDLALHNDAHLNFDESDEGELSILHSEITKMTLRIREQNESLKREKEHLADSLADIAHQLRTPLTSANLLLSLLADSPDAGERKAFVRETEELLARMDWLITALLKLSRLDAGIVVFKREPVNITDLMNTAIRPFLIQMELRGIELQTDAPKGVTIQGDLGWLSEAMQNIIKNCVESVSIKGKIEISCADSPLFVEIMIHDSGSGFEKEELPRLFDRFYRGKSADATGYGIGLALCKTIITRHGGTVVAKNHPYRGAVFVIRFPR